MSDTSLLMIHNAWTYAAGDSKDLRKQAEDLEKITQASINAYMDIVNIEEDELKEMMDNDTWLSGEEALEKGFATKILEVDEKEVPSQSIRNKINQKLIADNNTFEHKATIEEDKIEEIVQKQIKELEKNLIKVKEVGTAQKGTSDNKEKPKDENKLNSFMKAFFNTENEEE